MRPGPQWVRYAVLASAAIVSLLLALAVHRYLATLLGRLAPAIKDNEIRVEYMGAFGAPHVKAVIAAVLAGVGGALAATTVGTSIRRWRSGRHRGVHLHHDPRRHRKRGCALRRRTRSMAGSTPRLTISSPTTWQMSLGLALLLIIVFPPEGLWSMFRRRYARHP